MCEKKSWFLKYQSILGNVIVAMSVVVAIIQLNYQQQYSMNYNAFLILKEFTDKQKERQKLIVYSDWRQYFESGRPIPIQSFMKLYPSTDETRDIIFQITRLWNYYEAIDEAEQNEVISEKIYESNFQPLIEKDRKVLKNFPIILEERFIQSR